MIDINATVKIIKNGIQLRMHGWLQQCRVIECKANVIGWLRNINAPERRELWRIGDLEKVENGITAQGLGVGG